MSIRSIIGAAALAALVSSLVAVDATSAETRLAATPAILEVASPLGGVGAVEIRVENRGTDEATLISGIEELVAAEGLPSATAWSGVRPSRLTLEPGETAKLKLDLDIPEGTDPGGHYTAVSIATGSSEDDEAALTGVSGRIVVPVLITVAGDEQRPTPPAIPSFDRVAVFLETDGSYVTRADVRNDGQTHVALVGEVGIERVDADGATQPVASSTVPIGRVLPQRQRAYRADDAATLAPDQSFEATFRLAEPAHGRRTDEQGISDTIHFRTTPMVEIQDLAVCSTQDGYLWASVSLANDSTIGVAPEVTFQATSPDGVVHSISRSIPQVLAWPEEVTPLGSTMRAPSIAGEFELTTEVTIGDEVLRAASTIQTGDGGTVPLCPLPSAEAGG